MIILVRRSFSLPPLPTHTHYITISSIYYRQRWSLCPSFLSKPQGPKYSLRNILQFCEMARINYINLRLPPGHAWYSIKNAGYVWNAHSQLKIAKTIYPTYPFFCSWLMFSIIFGLCPTTKRCVQSRKKHWFVLVFRKHGNHLKWARGLRWVSTSPIFKWGEMSEELSERWRGHDTEREQKK